MARAKDSIQRLIDKGNTPDEIVKSGKYTKEEVDAYLNNDSTDSTNDEDSEHDEPENEQIIGGNSVSDDELKRITTETDEADNVREMADTTFNPAAGETRSSTERSHYTHAHNNKSIHEVQEVFDRPILTDNTETGNEGTAQPGTSNSGGADVPPAPANPALANASEDAKRSAAEKLYDWVVVPIYQEATTLIPLIVKFNPNKIRKMAAKDEIDLTMPMTFVDAEGQLITKPLIDLINEHNAEADKAFEYDEKFIKEAREPTIREFVKRGWGIAEEDELKWVLIMKGLDMLKNGIFFGAKKYSILSEAKISQLEKKKEARDNSAPQQQPQPQVQYTYTAPPTEPPVVTPEIIAEDLREQHEQPA